MGKGLQDHHGVVMYWKLRNPEQGFAVGSPAFNKPSFANTLPMDWFVTGKAPDSDLENAAKIDNTAFKAGPRSDYELTPMYMVSMEFRQTSVPHNH